MIEQDAKKLLAVSGAPLYPNLADWNGTVVGGVTPASRSAFRGGRCRSALIGEKFSLFAELCG